MCAERVTGNNIPDCIDTLSLANGTAVHYAVQQSLQSALTLHHEPHCPIAGYGP